ncbi:MAG: OadG family protein [Gammaproteobacteria bacterium]|nr:OadG family protein [Gammaproteobacteria bacterium]MBT8109088.1 OadG family protein [Gammaproteobacteria bacterium]NND46550.1 OadG family protein [Woeseiaceae bacterium]NNL43791.1 OadG family protein [Woeseiaceae bacterium]
MQPTLLDQGLTLMLVGMGTVFVFLSVLVAGMSLMALVVHRLTPTPVDVGASDEEVAAITAAITQHRKVNP